jgi:site-specific DNA recombinase
VSREAPLTGRIFDDRGNRMSPNHSRKGGARYGYYVSCALIQGQPQSAGSVARVPAAKIEAVMPQRTKRTTRSSSPCRGAPPSAPSLTSLLPKVHHERQPVRSAPTRVKLISAIARGRQWLSEIEAGTATIGGIAAREGCSKRHVNGPATDGAAKSYGISVRDGGHGTKLPSAFRVRQRSRAPPEVSRQKIH